MSENTEKFIQSAKNKDKANSKSYLKKVLRERVKARIDKVLKETT